MMSKADIGQLSKLSPMKWLSAVVFDWGLMVASLIVAGITQHWLTYIAAACVIGNRQHALGILGHDGAHRLVLRRRELDDFLTGLLFFWPIGISVRGWRNFHFDHHKFVGTSRDPELAGKASDAPMWDLPHSKRQLLAKFAFDMIGLGIRDVIKMRKGSQKKDAFGSYDHLGKLVWHASFVAICLIAQQLWVIAIWYVSLLTVSWAMSRLRLWTEHVGTAYAHRISVSWWQRSFLPHNTFYHYEHHRYPSVPFYNLPHVRRLDQSEPVLSLDELFRSFELSKPIPSGAPLA